MLSKDRILHWLIVSLLLLLNACGGSSSTTQNPEVPSGQYNYRIPVAMNDGWTVANAASLGIDTSVLETVVRNIASNRQDFRHIDSLAIIKDGQLILDETFKENLDFTDDWASNRDINLHVLNSVTKSYVSTLIGIAIDQGLISDVDVLVHDYFQDYQPIANWSDDKQNTTLQDWLTMRHGYVWDEWSTSYFDSSNNNAQMNNASDPMRFLLDRALSDHPGTTFNYSTGISYGLGIIVSRVSSMDIHQFMNDYLLQPLNISSYTYWALDGQIHMGSALYLSNRDMAKLGQLYLNGGTWNGARILSQAYIDDAITPHVTGQYTYGYQWWMRGFTVNSQVVNTYNADGLGGQYIIVIPEHDAIVAFQGDAYEESERRGRNVTRILQDFILPELVKD